MKINWNIKEIPCESDNNCSREIGTCNVLLLFVNVNRYLYAYFLITFLLQSWLWMSSLFTIKFMNFFISAAHAFFFQLRISIKSQFGKINSYLENLEICGHKLSKGLMQDLKRKKTDFLNNIK